jgi:hypothetical protein
LERRAEVARQAVAVKSPLARSRAPPALRAANALAGLCLVEHALQLGERHRWTLVTPPPWHLGALLLVAPSGREAGALRDAAPPDRAVELRP